MKDIAILLHETTGLLRRRFEAAAKPEGLTLLQWRALRLLSLDGPMRQVALGEALEASPMTVSDLAERLEGMGLISRGPDPTDSRAKSLDLTATGRAKVDAMRALTEAMFAEVFAGLTPEDIDGLRGALGKIKDNLAAM